MAGKQGEAGELKKALQLLETKRKDEVREKDRRLAELEKALTGEKKKKEAAEAKLQGAKGKGDEELQSARAAAHASEVQLSTARSETQQAQSALADLEEESTTKEEAFLAQLEQHRRLIGQVAEEYGHLVSTSVPRTEHARLKQQLAVSQIRTLRLERKLANSEGQVVELANLIRQSKENNAFLIHQLREAEVEIHFTKEALLEAASIRPVEPDTSLIQTLQDISEDLAHTRAEIHTVDKKASDLSAEFYRLKSEELLLAYSIADKQLSEAALTAQQHASDLSSALASHEAIAALLESVQKERATVEGQLKAATESTDKLRASSEYLTRQVAEIEGKLREAAGAHEEALKKERDTVKRLAGTVQTARMAEDAMRAEIETYVTPRYIYFSIAIDRNVID